MAQRTGGSASSPLGGLPHSGHHPAPTYRAFLVAISVTLSTTAPSSRAHSGTVVVRNVAWVATTNRLPLPSQVPDSLLHNTLATLGTQGVDWLECLVGRLCTLSAGLPTSVLLVFMVDLVGSLANNLLARAETQPVSHRDGLTLARSHRCGIKGHLVRWHQADYSSCGSMLRGRHCLPTPAWWPGVEVPYGCMTELPWCQAYAVEDLFAGNALAWSLFRIEWAVSGGSILEYRSCTMFW